MKTDTHVISTESACLGAREAIPWLRQGRYSGEGKQCRPVLATMSIEGTEAALSGMRNSCFESSPTILQLTRLPEGLLFSACGILYAHHSHEATRLEGAIPRLIHTCLLHVYHFVCIDSALRDPTPETLNGIPSPWETSPEHLCTQQPGK